MLYKPEVTRYQPRLSEQNQEVKGITNDSVIKFGSAVPQESAADGGSTCGTGTTSTSSHRRCWLEPGWSRHRTLMASDTHWWASIHHRDHLRSPPPSTLDQSYPDAIWGGIYHRWQPESPKTTVFSTVSPPALSTVNKHYINSSCLAGRLPRWWRAGYLCICYILLFLCPG